MARPDDTHPYGTRVLKLETPVLDGIDVWELQIKLIGWGSGSHTDEIGVAMDPVKITGKFDTTTRDAVKRFQTAHKDLYNLAPSGVVDAQTFRALDRLAVDCPILMSDLKCPCVAGKNDGAIPCRCTKHDEDGKGQKCDGFGKLRFKNKFLLDTKKLADDTDISGEKLNLYDKYEYPGMDKAVIWAVRAVMRRAKLAKRIFVVAGYRCWWDNYHNTDETRWHHRQSTLHLGKAIELYHDGKCVRTGTDPSLAECDECERIQKIATEHCGFQIRWQEPDRVSVAEVSKTARLPRTPFSVHIDTVRRFDPTTADENAKDFVQTDAAAAAPLYEGKIDVKTYETKIDSVSYPMNLGKGLDPRTAASDDYFKNTEGSGGGWFPIGRSRFWHGGIHLYPTGKPEVHAMASGKLIACRAGEAEDAKSLGSRNFVLLEHKAKGEGKFKDKVFYTLYMHLDEGKAVADAAVPWRRQLFLRTLKHVEALVPLPYLSSVSEGMPSKKRLRPWNPAKWEDPRGLAPGERLAAAGDPVRAKTLDDFVPDNDKFMVVKLTEPADTYVYVKYDDKDVATMHAPIADLADKLNRGEIVGLKDATPIPIQAGEVLGKPGKKAKDGELKKLDSFVHLEIFSTEALLTGGDYPTIDASAADKVADRKAVIDALVLKELLVKPPDGVLLDEELAEIYKRDGNRAKLRTAVVKMPSGWAVDWATALKAGPLTFLKDEVRDPLAIAFKEYNWWELAETAGAVLPDKVVHHYHPIAFLLELAYVT